MSLAEMESRGELEPLASSPEEIANLLRMALRRLADADIAATSTESRLVHSYQAILACGIASLRANDWRISNTGAKHYLTIETLQHTIGLASSDVSYCHSLRRKRHEDNYEGILHASEGEVAEALKCAKQILQSTINYLRTQFNHLLDP